MSIAQNPAAAHLCRDETVAVRFPAYAPGPNPVEYLWGMMKKTYLANLAPELAAVGRALRRRRRKIKDRHLLMDS